MWAESIGWIMCLSSILMIPSMAVIQLLRTSGTLCQRIAINITPFDEQESMFRGGEVKRFTLKHWFQI